MELAAAALSSSSAHVGPGNIRSLILEKEKELHDINEYRIRTLEALLRDKETATNTAKQKLSKLQEDFKYKLKLFEGRNEELARYEVNFTSLKDVLKDRETELIEIKKREVELQEELQCVKQQQNELEIQLRDARAQVEDTRWKFDKLTDKEDVMEAQKCNLERQLREKEDQMECQRKELTVTFNDVMREKEMEFKRTNEELQTKVRELELKNKTLVEDADTQCARVEELKTKNENLYEKMQENDKEMKSLEWTVTDVKAVKDAKVGELESEVVKLIEAKQQLMDEYENKMAEFLQLLHSVEKAFVQQKTQYDEELRCHLERKKIEMQEASTRSEAKIEVLTVRLRESEEKVETLQAELEHAKQDAGDRFMDTEREIKRVRSALQDLVDEHHCVAKEMQQRPCVNDREVQTLQERLLESARQIALLKEKDKTQRQELLEGVEIQKDLQRELVAVNLSWEKRWQEQQQELDERHELHLSELEKGKDCLLNEKQVVEERLLHAENEVQQLRSELLSLKASARSTDPFGSQDVASASRRNLAARISFESAPGASSPLWSGDSGTLSPVPDVSSHLKESPLLRPKTTAGTSANALETENAKLRDLIRQKKKSLTQQVEEMEALPEQAAGSRSASKRVAQPLKAHERCVALKTQRHKSSSPDSSIALQLESCKRELAEAQQSVDTKSRQIVELESRIQELEGERVAESQLQSTHAALEAQLTDLNWKLEVANGDIDRLVKERSQLMELNNQLRADLRRSGNDAESRSSTSRAEFAGKEDYENLVAELTQSLEKARIHNKRLKKELRWMVKLQAQFQQE